MGCYNSKRDPDCPKKPRVKKQKCKDNMVVFVPFSERDKFLEKDCSKAVLVYRMIRAAKPPPKPPTPAPNPCDPKGKYQAQQYQKPQKPQKRSQSKKSTCCTHQCCSDKPRKPSKGGDCCHAHRPCCCGPPPHGNFYEGPRAPESEIRIKEAQTQASCKARVSYFCGSSEDVLNAGGAGGKMAPRKRNEMETQTRCKPKVVFVCKSYNGSSTDLDQNPEIVEYRDDPSIRNLQ